MPKVVAEITQIVNTQRPDLPFRVLVSYKDDRFESEAGVCVSSQEQAVLKVKDLTGSMFNHVISLGRDNA